MMMQSNPSSSTGMTSSTTMDTDDDVQSWATRFHLTPSTIQALHDEGFTSTLILAELTPETIDEYFPSISKGQNLILKRAVKSLQTTYTVPHEPNVSSPSTTAILSNQYSSSPKEPHVQTSLLVNQDPLVTQEQAKTTRMSQEDNASRTVMTGVSGGDVKHSNVAAVNYGTMIVEGPRTKIPGTLGKQILDLKMQEAKRVFIKTDNYRQIETKLKEFGHMTICGASGEGKTTMSLILASDYRDKGYGIVFADRIEVFDLDACIDSTPRLFLIVDDIFGTVGISTNVTQLRDFLDNIITYMDHCKEAQMTANSEDSSEFVSEDVMVKQLPKKDIVVLFSSKTYNFKVGISRLYYQRLSLFAENTVVDLTKDGQYRYSQMDKKEIFQHHRRMKPGYNKEDISVESILNVNYSLFGFPLTCKLYFQISSSNVSALEFFKEPLFYLRKELHDLLVENSNKSAALILMLLCEDKLDLTKLELPSNDPKFENILKVVNDFLPPGMCQRSGMCQAVRIFRGTFFVGGDSLSFSHSSIYDACACALYNINPSFVLKHCSVTFMYERVKPDLVDATEIDDNNFIYVSENYHELIASRLAQAIVQGLFTKTITHQILKHDSVVLKLFEKIKSEGEERHTDKSPPHEPEWVHKREGGKCFLYWAVLGHNPRLVTDMEKETKCHFKDTEIIEATEGCVQGDNLPLLKWSFGKTEVLPKKKSSLLLMAAGSGSGEVLPFLIDEGADLGVRDEDHLQNIIHIACKRGYIDVLKTVEEKQHTVFIAMTNSSDFKGRPPVMLAALSGSEECFNFLQTKSNSDMKDIKDRTGDQLIHYACRGGETNIVKTILTQYNVNSVGKNGLTPLMLAAAKGQQNEFELLWDSNADPTILDEDGNSVLHYACHGGNIAIVQNLLPSSLINKRGMHGGTPVMVAATKGQQPVFELLASHGADLTLVDEGGGSLLHQACQGGNISVVQKLLTSTNINSKGLYGWTPIMVAAVAGHQIVFDMLLHNKADLAQVDENGNSLLHLACQGGCTTIVEQLISPSTINSVGDHGWTPVMLAADTSQLAVFELLLSHKADLTIVDEDDNTLLHIACQGGNTDIVEHLLPSTNIDKIGNHGWTPIMLAAVNGQRNVFDILVSHNADLSLLDDEGYDLLHLACQGGNIAIVQHLLTPDNVNSRGTYDWTPIMVAAAAGHQTVFDLLISKGADLSLLADGGDSLLHLACQGGNRYIVKHLLSQSNIDNRGMYGWTPIMVAAVSGQNIVFNLLASEEADLTPLDDDGDSILHLACKGGNPQIVQFLLSPSNIDSRGMYGWTPVMKAVSEGNQEVFDLLVANGANLTPENDEGLSLLDIAILFKRSEFEEKNSKLLTEMKKIGTLASRVTVSEGSSATILDTLCSWCNKPEISDDFNVCLGCQTPRYCSDTCQKKHWSSGHKDICHAMAQERIAIANLLDSTPDYCSWCSKEVPEHQSVEQNEDGSDVYCSNDCRVRHCSVKNSSESDKTSVSTKGEHVDVPVTSSVETCGWCKQPDSSHGLKMCSQCKNVAYCSKTCQRQHWINGHRKTCQAPPTMPALSDTVVIYSRGLVCSFCNNSEPSQELRECSQCKASYYCSETCQSEHWRSGHRGTCKPPQYCATLSRPDDKTSKSVCSWCNGQEPPQGLITCSQCKSTRYCSKTCQAQHWKNGHKNSCKALRVEDSLLKL